VLSLTLCLSINKVYAYNNEEDDVGFLSNNIDPLEVEPILIQPFGDKENDKVTDITPSNQSDFTNMKYISNSNYFLINPRHVPSPKSLVKDSIPLVSPDRYICTISFFSSIVY
jgi:hypothetical protein